MQWQRIVIDIAIIKGVCEQCNHYIEKGGGIATVQTASNSPESMVWCMSCMYRLVISAKEIMVGICDDAPNSERPTRRVTPAPFQARKETSKGMGAVKLPDKE